MSSTQWMFYENIGFVIQGSLFRSFSMAELLCDKWSRDMVWTDNLICIQKSCEISSRSLAEKRNCLLLVSYPEMPIGRAGCRDLKTRENSRLKWWQRSTLQLSIEQHSAQFEDLRANETCSSEWTLRSKCWSSDKSRPKIPTLGTPPQC